MRTLLIAGMAACLVAPGTAQAGIKVKSTIKTYMISGADGEALLAQMDRKGPKHGLLTRAIAQTRYAITWDIAWSSSESGCRVEDASAKVDVTYTYPRVASKLSPAMAARWNAFLRGVRKHEEMHGTIARRMVSAAEKAVLAVSIKKDRNCRKARAEVRRRIDAIYAKYEAQQRRFDDVEHRDGGNVSRLVDRLTR